MGFQNNCSLAIFIPQTNPLLIHMMKTRIVGNVIRRPLARSGFCLFYFSEPFKAWKAAYTASWEGCKLQASEFSSGATRVNGLWKKYRMTWLFAETIFNVKIAEAMLWVPIFAIEKTSMVESISVCMLTNWRYSCPTAIYGQSCYHPEETSALTEGHRFRELWVTKKYAVALYRKPKSKKGKKKSPDTHVQKKAELGLYALINLFSFIDSTDLSKPHRFMALQGLVVLCRENDNFWLRFKKQAISKSNFFKTQDLVPGRLLLKLGCRGQQEGKRQYGKHHSLLREILSTEISLYWKQQNLLPFFTLGHRSVSAREEFMTDVWVTAIRPAEVLA